MPDFENIQELPLIIYRRTTVENQLNDIRNLKAIQSALVRGDVDVTLNNVDSLNPEIVRELRTNHNKNFPLFANYEPPFRLIDPPPVRDLVADEDVHDMFEDTLFNGLRFEFIKILGGGGFGAATLWNVHLEGGLTQKVVIKIGLSDNFNAEEEEHWHKRYDGSNHTVQIVDINHLAHWAKDEFRVNHPGEPLQYNRGMDLKNEDLDAIILEYMCHGDLFGLLKKASTRRQFFPNRVLWGIWECIVLGLAAAAYQPVYTEVGESFEEELEAAREQGGLIDFLDELEETEISHDVHLDLEETNILAGKMQDHPFQPVFKLHDLGAFSYEMRDSWSKWTTEDYWNVRGPVKMARTTPEQTHQDWDGISTNKEEGFRDFCGDNLRAGHPIAGRYGSWTNIFMGAKTMEAAVTLKYIAHPFTSQRYTTLNGRFTANTYGWRLQRPSHQGIDPELRDILCRCLFERPIDRPNVVSLLRNIELRKQKGFQETEEDVKRFWDEFLRRPDPAEPIQQGNHPEDSWDRFVRSFNRKQNLRNSPPPKLGHRGGRQPARFRAWLRRQREARRAQRRLPFSAAQRVRQPRDPGLAGFERDERLQNREPVNPASREEMSLEPTQNRQPAGHVSQEQADPDLVRAPRQDTPAPFGTLSRPPPPQTIWLDFSGTHREPSPPTPQPLWLGFSGTHREPSPPAPPKNLSQPASDELQGDLSRVRYIPQTSTPSYHPPQTHQRPVRRQQYAPPGPAGQRPYSLQYVLPRGYPADAPSASHNHPPQPDRPPSISELQPPQAQQPRPLPEPPCPRPLRREQYVPHLRSEPGGHRGMQPEDTQNVQQRRQVQSIWGWSGQLLEPPRRLGATRRVTQQDRRGDGLGERPAEGGNMMAHLAATRALGGEGIRRRRYPLGGDFTTETENDSGQGGRSRKRRRTSNESIEESEDRGASAEVAISRDQDLSDRSTPTSQILAEASIPGSQNHRNSATEGAKKRREQQSKSGSGRSRTRASAIEEQVMRSQRQVPVAIQNMMARTQQLDERLKNSDE